MSIREITSIPAKKFEEMSEISIPERIPVERQVINQLTMVGTNKMKKGYWAKIHIILSTEQIRFINGKLWRDHHIKTDF